MRDEIVTTNRLAFVLGITARRVQQLAGEGVFNKVSRGKFHLSESIQKYISYQLLLEKKKYNKNDLEINEAKRKRETEEAFLKEMELEKRRGELLEKSEVINTWQKILSVIKTRSMALPTKLAPQIIGMDRVADIKNALDKEINGFLTEISEAKHYE